MTGELAYTFANGKRHVLKAGDIALFSEKSAYKVENFSGEGAFHYSINFTCHEESLFEDEIYFECAHFSDVTKKCESVTKLWRSGDTISKMRAIAKLYRLLCDLFEERLTDSIGEKDYSNMMSLTKHIEDNIAEDFSIEKLASYCMMSKTNFRRTFKNLFSVSPIEYVIRARLSKAAELLSASVLELSEISELCGLGDSSYFCKLFKKRTGYTPGELRKNKISLEEILERINQSNYGD